eukprot:IDg2182t1
MRALVLIVGNALEFFVNWSRNATDGYGLYHPAHVHLPYLEVEHAFRIAESIKVECELCYRDAYAPRVEKATITLARYSAAIGIP